MIVAAWNCREAESSFTIPCLKERLDRALASVDWCEVFKDARVTHIEVEASDHNIILLETEPRIRKPKRRFHFDPRWLQYREVEGLIQEAWGKNQVGSRAVRISRKIKQCRMSLSAWSRTLKLNSRMEIKRIKEEIQAARTRNGSDNKETIRMLRKQLSNAYKQEELYWNQRARIKWLQNGDKNTAYFHAVVKGRRKRNKISRLEKEQGGWCATEEEIAHFYSQLFTSSKPSEFDEILNGIPKTITEQMNLYSQAAFVQNRQILDNVIVAHEYMHWLKSKREGNEGYMAIKLDLSKAYDRVEWNFLYAILCKMGFAPLWIRWMHGCLSSVSYSFNVNGVKRGNKQITGVKIARQGPKVSHLFFADDSLIFCKANGDEAGHIKAILECYGKASGQQVNINKSVVFFSKSTGSRKKEEVLQRLGGIQQVTQGKYLGLPLVVGRSKNSVFRFIKENLMTKIQSWKGKLLSNAGKEVLLKSVATALPSYAMSVFRLSKSLCKELSGLMARFWWGNDQGEKRMHWKKWTDLAERKVNDGLGFRDLLSFNEALLAKQVWRILTCPNLLVSKVMKSRYFPNSNIFESKVKARASWIWQSLHSSLEMLDSGMWKQVGDGSTVEIWKDRWVECSKSGRVSSPKPNGYQLTKVCNLIKGRQWNKDIIQGLFAKEESEAIMSIPLSVFQMKDRFKWKYTANVCYSTKSDYARAKERIKEISEKNKAQDNSSTNKERSKVWNQFWGLNIKHKIKHFLWKCLHCILPTNEEIFRRTGKGDPLCKCCGEEQETTEHALLLCKARKLAWATFPVSWDGIKDYSWNFWKWWEYMQEARSRED
ncbi:uncharacterized protein [Coffea arabica]|uniref:Reverse transcriptase n=1 Tax=Coffea arabica TaxID=13443 RepID=A0ABM4V9H0_COFAR